MASADIVAEPLDLAAARLLITSLEGERRLLQEQLERSQRENELLRHKLDVLCRRLFGKKSEKVDPNQLRLALELLESETGSVAEPVEADSGESPRRQRGESRRRSTGRQVLPAELPRLRAPAEPRAREPAITHPL